MDPSNSILLCIMVLSILVQLTTALLALQLIRPSHYFSAWILLSSGFFIQGLRRIVSLYEVVSGEGQPSVVAEALGLTISLLMLLGVLKFKPLFSQIASYRKNLLDNQQRLEATNQQLQAAQKKLRKSNKNLGRLATLDGLTGIPNRRAFDSMLGKLWKNAFRNQEQLSLLMIDIDHFKSFNDRYGHLKGDDCLRKVALSIQRSCLRPNDFVARFGGEEFAVLLPKTSLVDARHVAERIQLDLQKQNIPHEGSQHNQVTLSIGVKNMLPSALVNEQQLFECADNLLYEAKQSGRNGICS